MTYNAAQSSHSAKNFEPIPTDNSQLANYAKQGGCYYTGPTTITLHGSQMTVLSKGMASYPGDDNLNFGGDTSTCPTDGSTKVSLPVNGVIFVDQGGQDKSGDNPFDGIGQTCGSGFGAEDPVHRRNRAGATAATTGRPHHRTPRPTPSYPDHSRVTSPWRQQQRDHRRSVTYDDCTRGRARPPTSVCALQQRDHRQLNDTLGLIANNYVEVNRPARRQQGNVLPYLRPPTEPSPPPVRSPPPPGATERA